MVKPYQLRRAIRKHCWWEERDPTSPKEWGLGLRFMADLLINQFDNLDIDLEIAYGARPYYDYHFIKLPPPMFYPAPQDPTSYLGERTIVEHQIDRVSLGGKATICIHWGKVDQILFIWPRSKDD